MRSREEILETSKKRVRAYNVDLILEVLLDIRDFEAEIKKLLKEGLKG